MEARRRHAGLVGLRTWDVLIFPTRKLTVSLVDASVYRRVPCTLLSLLGRCLRHERGSGNCQCQCKEKLICVAHGLFLSVGPNTGLAACARFQSHRRVGWLIRATPGHSLTGLARWPAVFTDAGPVSAMQMRKASTSAPAARAANGSERGGHADLVDSSGSQRLLAQSYSQLTRGR